MTDTVTNSRPTMTNAIASITIAALPAIGQPLDVGIFAGITTRSDGAHVAVVLLAVTPDSDLPWKDAMAWAASVGGELPSRPVAAMLFANLKAQFKADWHWTRDEHNASYAWYCDFSNGYQSNLPKSFEGRARAVREIPISG